MHAGCSAIVGAALAAAARRGILTRVGLFVAGLALAMGIHSGFNRLTRVSQPSALIITLVGVLAFVYAVGIVALGIPVSARWARKDMKARGLSASEQVALAGGSSVDDLLDEFEHRFGSAAGEAAGDLIALQRRIGILSRGGTSDDRGIAALTEQADDLRRRIGVFLFADLGASVTDTAGAGAPAGLWANLGATTNDLPPPAGNTLPPPSGGLWGAVNNPPQADQE